MPSFAPDRLSSRLQVLTRHSALGQGGVPREHGVQTRLPLRSLPSPRLEVPRDVEDVMSQPTIALGRNILDALGIAITVVGFFLALLWI